MLARSRGFSGSANKMVSVKLCSDDPCCHGNENLPNFKKICYNFSRRGDMSPILVPNIGFSGSVNLPMQIKFVSHQPVLPW